MHDTIIWPRRAAHREPVFNAVATEDVATLSAFVEAPIALAKLEQPRFTSSRALG